jgi:predicted aspartyl protease
MSIDRVKVLCALLLAGPVLAGCAIAPRVSQPGQGVSQQVRIIRGPQGATTVLLPVTIDGQGPFDFALDTGASKSLVDTAISTRLRLQRAGPPQRIQGVGGVETAQPVTVSDWRTGQIKLPQMVVSAAALPTSRRGGGLQGLLGSDVWNSLGKFTLDYRNSTLTVYTS